MSGDLTQTEERWNGIWNSYIQTVDFSIYGQYNIHEFYQWLKGSGYITFSTDPNRRQQARVVGAVTLNKHSHNLDWYDGEVQFYCQPLKEKLAEETKTILESYSTSQKVVQNSGDIWSKPLIKAVQKSGATSIVLTLSQPNISGHSRTVTIDMTGLTGQTIWIDCETMEVLNEAKTSLLTSRATTNYWPLLYSGENQVSGSGWSRVDITSRERFL